ncbi:MAG: L,D-transpeptidase [Kofleriaceae bacterium]|jgi:hypothetical protein|nr:L,D-transpeptidase [Kofleriaceae bacterium]MBP6840647.1 L,D-transpeptidase [Kofleriaceae bacterium]MBP9205433.1 L,D-transpeptidase [Kofleriaceae bacterium]
MSKWLLVVLVLGTSARAVAAPSPPTSSSGDQVPPPPATPQPGAAEPAADAPTLADLGWPGDTVRVEVTHVAAHVVATPSRRGRPLGKVMRGTRAELGALARGDRRCPYWVELRPRGWLCARDVAPTTAPVGGEVFPLVRPGAILPGEYYDVGAAGATAFPGRKALAAGSPSKALTTGVMVRGKGRVTVGDVTYVHTNKGLIDASALRRLAPSTWVGLDLRATPAPSWPFAFAVGPRRGSALIVRASPDAKAAVVRRLQRREQVAVVEVGEQFLRLGDGQWLARADARLVEQVPPPPGLGADEAWIDIDLDQQTLVAYQGVTPVYVTLVSTAIRRKGTPPGLYRIRAKAATTRMASEADEKLYDVGEVPWAMRFRAGLYLHAAYWHDGFGSKRSHGCVNLSPRDARALYEWAGPPAPPGWSEVEQELPAGVLIRIRDATTPAPPAYDYGRERKQAPPIPN